MNRVNIRRSQKNVKRVAELREINTKKSSQNESFR